MHATTSPKFVDQQPAVLAVLAAVVFAIGIALGAVMDLDLRIASTTSSVPAPDTSYDAVEGTRAQFGINTDTSYDAVEGTRAQLGVAPSSETAPAEQPERDGRYGAGYR